MSEQLYRRYNVDEETPVQFVGVYTTHWRPEWGEPEAMFAQVDDPLTDAASQLLEACEAALTYLSNEKCQPAIHLDAEWSIYEDARAKIVAAITAAKGEK